MKIWIVSRGCPKKKNPQLGIFEFDQARALMQAGHDVVFLSLDLRSIRRWRKWGIQTFEIESIPIFEINVPCGPIPYKLHHIVGKFAFKNLFKKAEELYGKPDIVHAHFGNIAEHCADYVVEQGIKFVVTEHNSKIMAEPILDDIFCSAQYAYRKADKLIAVSGALANRIYDKFNIKAEVIGNILDEKNFPLEKVEKKEKSKPVVFCSCGNLIPRKGFDVLIKAFARMDDKSAKLIIIGGGECRKELEQLVLQLNIKERVEFKGRCTRDIIRKIYEDSDCFVLPSRSETFGVVYIEALATGLPVIATRCGGPEDIITDETGVLVEVDDIEGLTATLDDMISNCKLYDGQYCVEYIRKHFSGKEISAYLEKVYKS